MSDSLTEPNLSQFIQPNSIMTTVHGTMVDKLEQTFFSWMGVAAIFLAAALIITAIKRSYTLFFLAISILLLLAGAFDYLGEGQILIRSGLQIPPRLPLLFWIILAVVVIEVVLFFDFLSDLTCKPKPA
jgi:hypothetical protein